MGKRKTTEEFKKELIGRTDILDLLEHLFISND